MLLAVFAVLSSKRTKSNPILYFCTVFRPWKMTQSRKQPIFDIKRKIYFKARFKYILPLFVPHRNPPHLLEHVPEKVQRQGWNLESMLSALLKQRPTLLQPAGFNRLTFQPKPICGESCSGSRPGTFQAEYSSTRQNADNELSPFREGNGAERDTPHYP